MGYSGVRDVIMKKTAIEWLIEKYIENGIICLNDIQQAKELEKQQITRAYSTGGYDERDNPTREAHEYYNKTFGNEIKTKKNQN